MTSIILLVLKGSIILSVFGIGLKASKVGHISADRKARAS